MVYLIAEPSVKRDATRPDLSPLAKFGELKVCLPSGHYPVLHPKKTLDILFAKLDAFRPESDYLAWAGGDTLAALLTGVVLAEFGVTRIKWLRYQRGWKDGKRIGTDEGSYRSVMVDIIEPKYGEEA